MALNSPAFPSQRHRRSPKSRPLRSIWKLSAQKLVGQKPQVIFIHHQKTSVFISVVTATQNEDLYGLKRMSEKIVNEPERPSG